MRYNGRCRVPSRVSKIGREGDREQWSEVSQRLRKASRQGFNGQHRKQGTGRHEGYGEQQQGQVRATEFWYDHRFRSRHQYREYSREQFVQLVSVSSDRLCGCSHILFGHCVNGRRYQQVSRNHSRSAGVVRKPSHIDRNYQVQSRVNNTRSHGASQRPSVQQDHGVHRASVVWPRQSRVQPVLESEEEYYDREFPQLKPQTSKHREEQFGEEENVGVQTKTNCFLLFRKCSGVDSVFILEARL